MKAQKSYIKFAYEPEDFLETKLDVARLDLIDRCRKREFGARFRIETRNQLHKIKIDAARLDLIDKCRKRELGARFRIETRT